jgi:hypothetical protein
MQMQMQKVQMQMLMQNANALASAIPANAHACGRVAQAFPLRAAALFLGQVYLSPEPR